MIAKLQVETTQASLVGAGDLLKAMQEDAEGSFDSASYRVIHGENGEAVLGVADTGAKLNVNTMTAADFMLIPSMTEDIAAAILDYVDADDEPNEGGAEAETYGSLTPSYRPRNAPIQHLEELELVEGVYPEMVRGIDFSLDGIIEDSENVNAPSSGSRATSSSDTTSFGWSAILTASSTIGGYGPTGLKRVDLSTAQAGEVSSIAGVDGTQAELILGYAQAGIGPLEDFIRVDLTTMAAQVNQAQGTTNPNNNRFRNVQNLSRDQLKRLYDGCSIGEISGLLPGKLNINTAAAETFDYISALDPAIADAIRGLRDSSGGNLQSVVDLLDLPELNRTQVAALARILDTRSNVFEFTAVGRDDNTGLSVEMQVQIDRSTLPVTIKMIRIR